jgi:hypothetical protein
MNRMSLIERAGNEIAAVLMERCTVEECENTLAEINPADWQRAAQKVLDLANPAVDALAREHAAVLDCVNLYGDETLHKALDNIGWPTNYIGRDRE